MLTEFVRDHAFTIAWFGLMAVAWFGWSQEDAPSHWRWKLGAGSVAGLALAGVFGYAMVTRWGQSSALEGRYEWFGLLVLVEVVAATIGSLYLQRSEKGRWAAWWVAMVVAAHFIPLAFLVADGSLIVLGVLQAGALLLLARPLKGKQWSTSRIVGPMMGLSMLLFAVVSAALFVTTEGGVW
ncbi:hypothetical protein [Nesterenkonia halotolerans]|uniref:Uncharacterized protein n=1 Tax=Nesterenkonia halotolerans TaxID=225325 RepID=A0ABR9J8K4_9MICC|nr:hypothetical protein [Nesterenkonia halotolerans]MBE1515174.1 hypothetical protein [Nesterenkonia halotolerans]